MEMQCFILKIAIPLGSGNESEGYMYTYSR